MPTELSVKTTLAGDRTPQHSARDGGWGNAFPRANQTYMAFVFSLYSSALGS